jgi:glycosyltransferase involved in cell wall biosynthesis
LIPSPRPHWHILTGEYPPHPGGVGDYTYHVASGLSRAGDPVTVWTTPASGPTPEVPGVTVRRQPDLWAPRGLARLSRALDAEPAPRRLLIQYTPFNWGYRGLNVAFGRWLLRRGRSGDDIWTMVHEVYYSFQILDRPTRWLIAAATAWNIRNVLAASRRVFYTIPAWEPLLRQYSPHRDQPRAWLPVPANVLPVPDPEAVARLRARVAPEGRKVLGYFGTFGSHTGMLLDVLNRLLPGHPDRTALLIGRGGSKFAADHPELAPQLAVADGLPFEDVSIHLQACDLMIQPYVDGVSTRRTTVMAALAHGLPVVSAVGALSEPFWSDSGAVALAEQNEPDALAAAAEALLSDPARQTRLGETARTLYNSRFAIDHVVETLRRSGFSASEPATAPPSPRPDPSEVSL